jgi:hypothetical protein
MDNESQAAVERALADSSGSVRVAAARAAWRSGHAELALPVVRAAATARDEFVALEAMHLIDEMGAAAEPIWDIVAPIANQGPDYYPARIAEYLLQRSTR